MIRTQRPQNPTLTNPTTMTQYPDPTPSEFDNDKYQSDNNKYPGNRTGGDWEMEYEGEVEINKHGGLEYKADREKYEDRELYEGKGEMYEHGELEYHETHEPQEFRDTPSKHPTTGTKGIYSK
jgi:hypothetical protein